MTGRVRTRQRQWAVRRVQALARCTFDCGTPRCNTQLKGLSGCADYVDSQYTLSSTEVEETHTAMLVAERQPRCRTCRKAVNSRRQCVKVGVIDLVPIRSGVARSALIAASLTHSADM